MKIEILSKDGALKLRKNAHELYLSDVKLESKHFIPGEWIYLFDEGIKAYYLASINTQLEKNLPSIKVINIQLENKIKISIEEFVLKLIEESIERRKKFNFKEDCCRLVFGGSDYLPGLTVDGYSNAVLVQIHSAGIDLFRDAIFKKLSTIFNGKKIISWDNEKQRIKEKLPIHPKTDLNELKLFESDLEISLDGKTLQKIGYYYDHRDNRIRMKNLIKKLNFKPDTAIDLYSYCGAWGMTIAQTGIKNIIFVDQADMENNIRNSWKLNSLEGEFTYKREDVFTFLENEIKENKKYKIICSDPPAFAKTKNEKNSAIEGYKKLHKKIFKCLDSNSILFSSSCTHYVNNDEFQSLILDTAIKEKRKIQLLDIGMQSVDHPIKNTNESSNYIKYYAYWVE